VSVAVVAVGAAVAAIVWPTTHAPRNHVGARQVAKGGHALHTRSPLTPRIARLALPQPLPRRTLMVPILMYHRIGSSSARTPMMTRALTVPTAVFGAQMRWLERNGFRAITQAQLFDALEHGTQLPARPVMITFDDGYRDVLWNAAPILARLHLPATAYVITGRVSGPDSSFLTWPDLRALERHRIMIGSHTVDHLELTGLSDAAALQELTASRRALEAHLHHPVQWFSYPAGRNSPHVRALVAKAGYVLAVTTNRGALRMTRSPWNLVAAS
jgi:peptidoglycan/xylan/chitin deacetylase (PgdA/CDA1 family)